MLLNIGGHCENWRYKLTAQKASENGINWAPGYSIVFTRPPLLTRVQLARPLSYRTAVLIHKNDFDGERKTMQRCNPPGDLFQTDSRFMILASVAFSCPAAEVISETQCQGLACRS